MHHTKRPTRIALAGLHGYGSVHLEQLRHMAGAVKLVAVADPRPPAPGSLPESTQVFDDLAELLASVPDLDVVIIATPLDTHFRLAELALRAGAHVYLEKPPVTSMADFDRLVAVERECKGSVQVGFQGLGLHQSTVFTDAVAGIGEVSAIGAVGLWQRSDSYWNRSRWAGRRVLDGVDIVDGTATNPFAHAVVSALHLAGVKRRADIGAIDTDLFRANAIESDDTAVVRIETTGDVLITCAFTLCAAMPAEPYLRVTGSLGTLRFRYTEDCLELGDGLRIPLERRCLLRNMVEHVNNRAELISPLCDSEPFMVVLDAIRTGPAPSPIPPEFLSSSPNLTVVVDGIEQWIELAVERGATFTELGAPWAQAGLPLLVDVAARENAG